MIANISHSFLSEFPRPPTDFLYVPKDTPGKYVFGETTFNPDRTFYRPAWHQGTNISFWGADWVIGACTLLLMAAFTELVLSCCVCISKTCCPCQTSQFEDVMTKPGTPDHNTEEAMKKGIRFAKDVDDLRNFNFKSFFKRIGKHFGLRRMYTLYRESCVVVLVFLLLLLNVLSVNFAQTEKDPSSHFEYNLRGSHPIGTNLGLGKFVRRNFRERPCITPVVYDSNPIRNFSISTCYGVSLEEAHNKDEDRVSSITIGSWFHKGGSDHQVLFGDANITVMARAFIYGTRRGTHRLLFPNLRDNYISVTQYLHQLVIYKILNDSCYHQNSTKSCQVLSNHQIEARVVKRKIRLWLPRSNEHERFLYPKGLETTLRAEIQNPWQTVFQSIGPLLTTELIEEVRGSGSYSHIKDEKEEEDIPGLIYLEAKRFGGVPILITLAFVTVALSFVKGFGGSRSDSSTLCDCQAHLSGAALPEN